MEIMELLAIVLGVAAVIGFGTILTLVILVWLGEFKS